MVARLGGRCVARVNTARVLSQGHACRAPIYKFPLRARTYTLVHVCQHVQTTHMQGAAKQQSLFSAEGQVRVGG